MDQQSLFFTFIVAIVALLIELNIISIYANKQKIKSLENNNISLILWYLNFLIPFFLLLKIALELIENSIEVLIYSTTVSNTFVAVMEKIFIFSGLVFLFSFLIYFSIERIVSFFITKKDNVIEIENNNYSYFLFKLSLTVFLTFSLLRIFEDFLKWFLPIVETPFYH
jgi:hypothetical protein